MFYSYFVIKIDYFGARQLKSHNRRKKMEFVVFCLLLVGQKFTLYRYNKSAEEVVSTLL